VQKKRIAAMDVGRLMVPAMGYSNEAVCEELWRTALRETDLVRDADVEAIPEKARLSPSMRQALAEVIEAHASLTLPALSKLDGMDGISSNYEPVLLDQAFANAKTPGDVHAILIELNRLNFRPQTQRISTALFDALDQALTADSDTPRTFAALVFGSWLISRGVEREKLTNAAMRYGAILAPGSEGTLPEGWELAFEPLSATFYTVSAADELPLFKWVLNEDRPLKFRRRMLVELPELLDDLADDTPAEAVREVIDTAMDDLLKEDDPETRTAIATTLRVRKVFSVQRFATLIEGMSEEEAGILWRIDAEVANDLFALLASSEVGRRSLGWSWTHLTGSDARLFALITVEDDRASDEQVEHALAVLLQLGIPSDLQRRAAYMAVEWLNRGGHSLDILLDSLLSLFPNGPPDRTKGRLRDALKSLRDRAEERSDDQTVRKVENVQVAWGFRQRRSGVGRLLGRTKEAPPSDEDTPSDEGGGVGS